MWRSPFQNKPWTIIDNFPRSSVGWRVELQSMGRGFESCTGFTF